MKSVFTQTHRPIELILVDDASDSTYSPCISSTPDFVVLLLRHEINKGPGASRETGRLVAKGDFITYLDSDDLWDSTFLEKQVLSLTENPLCGMSYSKTAEFFNGDKITNHSLRRRNEKSFKSIFPTIFFGRPWSTSACLWTRGAVERIGPWSDGWAYEDVEYDFRAGILKTQICHLPEVLCFKRTGTFDQLSNTETMQAIKQKYYSVSKIIKFALAHKKEIPGDIKILYARKLLRPLLEQLVAINEVSLAKKIGGYMIKISPIFSWQRIISLFLFFSLFLIRIHGVHSLYRFFVKYST